MPRGNNYLSIMALMSEGDTRRVKIGHWQVTVRKLKHGAIELQADGGSPCRFGRFADAARHLQAMRESEKRLAKLV